MFSFSNRFVGVELEIPQDHHRLCHEMEDRNWNIHDDGSIPEDGGEYVSPKMAGDKILNDISMFYSIAAQEDIRPEHHTCGMHCHVDARDVFQKVNAGASKEEIRLREDRVRDWGTAVSALSRLFVGPSRNGTRFAAGGFAIRSSYNCEPAALKKSRRVEYPTLAIREETFEFRVFPSTTVRDYTLARVAWAQACVDWLHKRMHQADSTWRPSFRKFIKPLKDNAALQDLNVMLPLWEEIGLCEDAQQVLMSIAQKFQVPNRAVLPGIWQRERDLIIEQEQHLQVITDTMVEAVRRYNTPDLLRRNLRETMPSLDQEIPPQTNPAEETVADPRTEMVEGPRGYRDLAAASIYAGSMSINNDESPLRPSMSRLADMFRVAVSPRTWGDYALMSTFSSSELVLDECVTEDTVYGTDDEDACDCGICLEQRALVEQAEAEISRVLY